jgi:hypothetical protein
VALVGLTAAGCQQAQTEMKVERPAELDHLDMFVGDWEFTAEKHAADSDKVETATGTDSYRWACNRWVLVDEWEGTAEGEHFEGLMVWTWDPQWKKYRYWGFYPNGATDRGTATYDEEAKAWHFKGKSTNRLTGKTKVGEGTLKCEDEDTISIKACSWGPWKLKKLAEAKGELRRK